MSDFYFGESSGVSSSSSSGNASSVPRYAVGGIEENKNTFSSIRDDFIYQVNNFISCHSCDVITSRSFLLLSHQIQFKFNFRYCRNVSDQTLSVGDFVIIDCTH